MGKNKPPFETTFSIVKKVADIAELVGQVNATKDHAINPTLRRTNRIRTIYSSLAIEQNTLSLDQVTAVLEGKRVLAPPKDIAEVKNAYEIYEMMGSLNPYSVDDLLGAHGVMTRDLIEESGQFRSGSVGVVDKDGNVIHFGTLPAYVPNLVMELLDWVKESDAHMLIKSCVFHYELELIHPFADGNGRMGRLWHTLLLTQWKPLFAWLPVESIIHDRQDEYYHAINRSNSEGKSTVFIDFMLSAIKDALIEVVQSGIGISKKTAQEIRYDKVLEYAEYFGAVTNANVREMFGVSPSTANRVLAQLVEDGKLIKKRIGKYWGYISTKI